MAKKKKTVSSKEVVATLHAEDYAKASGWGDAATRHLQRIVKGRDVNLACKAVYVCGVVNTDRSAAIVDSAARMRTSAIKVAAANAAGNFSAERATPILNRLLRSKDLGIRQSAVRAAGRCGCSELLPCLVAIEREQRMLHKVIKDTLKQLKQRS